jgi:glucose-1-phosphate cytidylyltransferase
VKVVLFCGGLGMRIRDYSDNIPKPMVPIGYRPIMWHVMKYYAHHGHNEFVLCLGYRADAIKRYFLDYEECLSNDFVLSGGGRDVVPLKTDIADWRITFCDTGVNASIGERLRAVRRHLDGEPEFLANYSDGLTDCPLDRVIDYHRSMDVTATFISVTPNVSYHFVQTEDDGHVSNIEAASNMGLRINGGGFVLRNEIFEELHPGEDLVGDALPRLIRQHRVAAYRYDGFWASMDTFKDKQSLDEMHSAGNAPWEVWERDDSEPRRDARA